MTLAVAFAMATAYILSRTLIPTCAAAWLEAEERGETSENRRRGFISRAFDRWQQMIDDWIEEYGSCSTGCSIIAGSP